MDERSPFKDTTNIPANGASGTPVLVIMIKKLKLVN
jgi:hypothetical protein